MEKTGGDAHLAIEGELTIYRAMDLRQKFVAALEVSGPVDVDLSGVSEIDSAGLQLLLALARSAGARSKSVAFVRHSEPVRELLELTNLGPALGVLPATGARKGQA